jgi:hypothetical protein
LGQQIFIENVYSERYIAFIDILGFTNHVRQSEHSMAEAQSLVFIMDRINKNLSDEALQPTHDLFGEDFKYQSFSDCTVFSEAATAKGLHYLLFSVTRFAVDLLANGFLFRGGIAKGSLHHSKNAVFGPAFLEAYHLEQNIAKYPRIVVDQPTHKDFEATPPDEKWSDKFIRPNLAFADDGPVYVDVFSAFKISDAITNVPSRVELFRRLCRDQIQAKLNEAIYVPAHYEKLHWLMTLWNTTVERESLRYQWIETPAQRDFEKAKCP